MATATQSQVQVDPQVLEQALIDKVLERTIQYQPIGSEQTVKLNPSIVRHYLARPTRSGHLPSDADIMQFMMLCRSRGLDPWVGDAYLVGYDSQDGAQFSLITSIQALLTRAELCLEYDGMESGVIVSDSGGQTIERQGDVVFPSEQLLGAWARVHRKDRKIPAYRSINRSSYDKGRSLWKSNPAGMCTKCARAAALRDAFPKTLGGLHTAEEAAMRAMADAPEPQAAGDKPSSLDALADRLLSSMAAKSEPVGERFVPDEQEDEPLGEDDLSANSLPDDAFAACTTLTQVASVEAALLATCEDDDSRELVGRIANQARDRIRSTRGRKSNALFETAPSAQEAGI